jgi:hypothetical protein
MIKGKTQPQTATSVFIGNARTKEVHHSGFATAQCRVDKITVKNKRIFQDLDEARAANYDLCHYCFDSKQ